MSAAVKAERLREAKDRATALLAKNKLAPALAALQSALELAPHDIALHQKSAEVLVRLGRTAEAIRAYQHVVGGWADEGHVLRAIAICKVILQLDPAHTQTQRALAELYARHRGPEHSASVPAALGSELGARRPDSRELTLELAPVAAAAQEADEPELEIEIDDSDVVVEAPSAPNVPLFSELGPSAFEAVLEGVELAAFSAGELIVREGETDQRMFALVQGSVRVLREDGGVRREVAQMEEGAFFGEMALVAGAPRLASVEAATDAVLLVFTRERMREIFRDHPSVEKALERFYRERLLANLMRSSPTFAPLTEAEREALASAFKPRSYARGDVLLRAGLPADGLHVILRGRCRPSSPDGGDFPDLHEGDVFGEISLVTGKAATATVKALSSCTVLRLPVSTFRTAVLGNPAVGAALRKLGAERLARKPAVARPAV